MLLLGSWALFLPLQLPTSDTLPSDTLQGQQTAKFPPQSSGCAVIWSDLVVFVLKRQFCNPAERSFFHFHMHNDPDLSFLPQDGNDSDDFM